MLLLDEHPVLREARIGMCAEEAEREIADLRQALRDSRQRLRRSALQGVRQISALNAEIGRLQQLCAEQDAQLRRYEEGFALIELARSLLGKPENQRQMKEIVDEAVCHQC